MSTRFSNAILIALACAPEAHADFFLHHWEDRFEPMHRISLEGDLIYYSTSENYDALSNKIPAAGLNSYHRTELDLTGQFGVADRFSVFGRLSWARISADQTAASATTYGFTDQSVGATFRVYETPLMRGQWLTNSFDFQFQADFPAYSNAVSDPHSPLLGDHTLDLTPGGFVSLPVWQDAEHAAVLTGGAGYTFRTNGYPAQVPWTVLASYAERTSGLTGSFGSFGTSSIGQTAVTLPSTGSFITGSPNAESILVRGELGYQFEPGSEIHVACEKTLWGQSAPSGSNVWIGYRTTFGAATEDSKAYEKSNQGLQQYSLDAKVTKVNDRLNLVKIDKGSADGVENGQIFDLFSTSADGSATEAVARAQVTRVKSEEAALTVTEYFKEVWINEGNVAKRLVR